MVLTASMLGPALSVALCCTVASAPSARALALVGLRQDPDPTQREAAEAFAEGEAAYAREDFSRAAEAFGRAQRLAPHPDTEFNLALALARADQPLAAWRIFERLQVQAPTAELRRDAASQLSFLRASVAVIEVDATDGTPVCIDGARQAPGTQWVVAPGPHLVALPGFERSYALQPGETRHVDLRFVAPAPSRQRARPRAIAPLLAVGAVAAAAGTASAAAAVIENQPAVARGWSIGAATAGAVALGTVVAALTLAVRAKRGLDQRQRPLPSCPPVDPDAVIVRTAP